MPIDIKSLYINELEELFVNDGYKKFRAAQVFEWIRKGVKSFDEMSNISKDMRTALEAKYYIPQISIVNKLVSKEDGTIKYLFVFEDGERIESVFMKYNHGNTVCISTQAGCRMGCAFCASTINGLSRNLLSSEMLLQVEKIEEDTGERVSNIVLMGIGEPLDNYDNVYRFLKLVNNDKGLNIGMRHISLSTCGLVDKIGKLAEAGVPVTLSVSLHAPDDEIRRQIMPIANKFSVEELIHACTNYAQRTSRRVSYEYAMISGLNDTDYCARTLAKKLKGTLCHVNLIPINSVEGKPFVKSDKKTIERFKAFLEESNIAVTVRRKLGSDIDASCGQLRQKRGD